jgi:ADP-heptose:LPS heptosyltransferase
MNVLNRNEWSQNPTNWPGAEKIKRHIPAGAKLQLFAAGFLLRCQNVLLQVLHKILFSTPKQDYNRILLFRTGSLGDSVCAIPSIRAIRSKYPNAQLDILTNAGSKNLVGLHYLLEKELYHEIIDYQGMSRKELFLMLKKKNYDLIIQLPQVDSPFKSLLRDMLVFRNIASRGWGWRKSQVKLFRKTQAKYLQFHNEVRRIMFLLQRNRVPVHESKSFLYPGPEDLQKARDLFDSFGISAGNRPVAIVVGAKRPQNRWPILYFKEVVRQLSNKYTIVLIGSAEDGELVTPLLDISNVINTCGQLTPMQSAAALSFCCLTISNDTGPMHLSYAVGTPTIAIFSSRDLPGKWFPPETGNVFRGLGILCEACFSELCENNICMQSILPEAVIARAEYLLDPTVITHATGFQ